MAISRRSFLGRSSVFSLAALVPLASQAQHRTAPSASDAARHELLGSLTSESFSAKINTTFEIQVSALDTQELELIEVSKKNVWRGGEAFAVILRGQEEKQFEQGTYVMHHAQMGSFPVFVVPVGTARHGVRYQAVFSRMR